MTLAVVRFVNVSHLEDSAEAIANVVANSFAGTCDVIKHNNIWACAFHHAIDLLAYARRLRTTTRCLSNYAPNDIERKVEAILADRGITRGMHE